MKRRQRAPAKAAPEGQLTYADADALPKNAAGADVAAPDAAPDPDPEPGDDSADYAFFEDSPDPDAPGPEPEPDDDSADYAFFEDGPDAAGLPDDAPDLPDPDELGDEPDPPRLSLGRRMLRGLGRGLLKLCFWLVMVALCVLVLVAGVGYFLYQDTTAAELPAASPTFAGQPLIATDYLWRLPVVGPVHRTFNLADSLAEAAEAAANAASEADADAADADAADAAEPIDPEAVDAPGAGQDPNAGAALDAPGAPAEDAAAPTPLTPPEDPQLLDPISSVSPALVLPDGMDSQLEIYPAGKAEPVFSGDGAAFASFVFAENGSYDATLTLSQGEVSEADPSEAVGHYTYHFRFTLTAKPEASLSTEVLTEGSVLGLRVTGLTGDLAPWVSSELGGASFVRRGDAWVAYFAAPESFLAGEYVLKLTYGEQSEEIPIRAAYRQTQELDTFTIDGTAAIPYLGAAPANIQPLFAIADPEIYWADTGFIQPVQGHPVRNYAVIEYTDRIVDPVLLAADPALAEYNKTIPGRRSNNVTFATRPGAEIVAPADGRVVFTGLAAGSRCVVIEHGCGLKSLFYLLARIDVSEGDYVQQGQLLGTAQGHTICEVRLGEAPINPWEVWGNYGGLSF